MFSFVRIAIIAAFLTAFSCSPLPLPPPIDNARSAAHHVELSSRTIDLQCSSVAVGPQTLLTAAHCMPGTRHIIIDDETAERTILSALYDDNDHVLLVIDGTAFTAVLPIEQRKAVSGERVSIWGWPGEATKPVHREGFFLHAGTDKGFGDLDVWQLPVYGGDSGSGMVSDKGTVIAIVSLANNSAETKTFPLAFSKEQLEAIR